MNRKNASNVITEKARQRSGYARLDARDPNDLKLWDVLVSPGRLGFVKQVGGFLIHETRFIVPHVLVNPIAIYAGLLSDDDEDQFCEVDGWLCYLGQPKHLYDNEGRQWPATSGRPYLVFLNAERVAYTWRFDDDMRLPGSYKHRFKEKLL